MAERLCAGCGVALSRKTVTVRLLTSPADLMARTERRLYKKHGLPEDLPDVFEEAVVVLATCRSRGCGHRYVAFLRFEDAGLGIGFRDLERHIPDSEPEVQRG